MKILLIGDETELVALVRATLKGKQASLKIVKSVGAAEVFLRRERPEVVIYGLMEKGNSIRPHQVALPDDYRISHDYWQFDLTTRRIATVTAESAAYFLRTLPILEDQNRALPSPFIVARGTVTLRERSKTSTRIATKAYAAHHALVEAKEALEGLASFEEDPETIGNRVPAPLSREVIRTIGLALDTSIASTRAPLAGNDLADYWKSSIGFLKNAERAIRQLEKTATAGVKASAILGVLAASLAVAVLKLKELLEALVMLN